MITDEGATTASSAVTYLLPVVSVGLGVVVLSEPLLWNLAVGGLLVLAGVALSQGRMGVLDRLYSRSPGERVR